MNCPIETTVASALLGKLPLAELESVFAHIDQCDACRQVSDRLEADQDDLLQSLRSTAESTYEQLSSECQQMIQSVSQLASVDRSPSQTAASFLPSGTRIRDYELIELLGQGGMGTVYRAVHTRLKRQVALKMMSSHRVGNSLAVDRFQSEMEAIGKLDHPNIIRALDAGEDNGCHYLVMELVNGLDARQLVKQVGPLPVGAAAQIIRQAAKGLAYVHRSGLVHRDIKPSNLMVTRSGRVLVLDLGLALLRDASAVADTEEAVRVMGSIDYMAPEQAEDSRHVKPLADIYSLGCSFYYLLVGHAPHQIRSTLKSPPTIDSSLEDEREDVPPEIVQLIDTMLREDPVDRVQNANSIVQQLNNLADDGELRSLLNGISITDPLQDTVVDYSRDWQRSTPASKPRSLRWLVPTAVALAVLVGIVALVWQAGWLGGSTARDVNKLGTKGDTLSVPAINTQVAAAPSSKDYESHEIWVRENEHREVRVLVNPGYEVVVTVIEPANAKSPLIYRAWDLIELMLEHEAGFDLYQQYAGQLGQGGLYPFEPAGEADPSNYVRRKTTQTGNKKTIEVRESDRSLRFVKNTSHVVLNVSTANGPPQRMQAATREQLSRQHPDLAPLLERYFTDE